MLDPIAVDIQSVSKHFDEVLAVDAISAQIRSGQLTGLVGPDGAGKTTLMRMLANLMQPSSGHIHLHTDGKQMDISAMVGYMP